METRKKTWAIRKNCPFAFCVLGKDDIEIPVGECYGSKGEQNAKLIVDLLNKYELEDDDGYE